MGERFKTILFILFISGVIGAFNNIVRLSQNAGKTPLQTITTALGLTPQATPEPSRKFEYLQRQLAQPQGSFVPTDSTENQQPFTDPDQSLKTTPTPAPSSGIQTVPELPPLPPITNTLGASVNTAPDLPPLNKPEPTLENQIQNFLEKTANFFGF